jgi:hypothetical protein
VERVACSCCCCCSKTFTMQGSQDKPGLVPQALSHIFKVWCTGVVVVLFLL